MPVLVCGIRHYLIMMVIDRISRKISLLIIFCSFLIGIALCWNAPLKITVGTDSSTDLSIPTYPGDTCSLHFIHSVHKTPVWENFVIDGVEKLTLVSTEYQSYGVGMPSILSEGVFRQKEKGFMLTDINRGFDQIPLRVGPEAKVSIIHQGQEYLLYQWYNPGTLVYVRISYDYLWWYPFNWIRSYKSVSNGSEWRWQKKNYVVRMKY